MPRFWDEEPPRGPAETVRNVVQLECRSLERKEVLLKAQILKMDRLKYSVGDPAFQRAISREDKMEVGRHLTDIVEAAQAAYSEPGRRPGAHALDGLVVEMVEKFGDDASVIEAGLHWALLSRDYLGELD